jgi:ATP-dependent protease Clp ATPase subunit
MNASSCANTSFRRKTILAGEITRRHPDDVENIILKLLQSAEYNIERAQRFTGLEKIISARSRSTSIGFGAKVAAPEDRKAGQVFREVEPEDLLKYGLIPEFVGRLPVLATLEDNRSLCANSSPKT